jgi:flavin-dependent dehydrogenase
MKKYTHKKYTHIAMRAYAKIQDPVPRNGDPAPLRLDFLESLLPAYGWVFPAADSNIGVGIPISKLRSDDRGLRNLFDDYVKTLIDRGFIVEDIRDFRSHQLPHAAGMSRFTDSRVALVGDAACMINPLSGEGVFYGMAAGEMLGQAMLGINLANSKAVCTGLRKYERAFRKRFRLHLWSSWLVHRLFRSRRWATIVTKAASRDPRVMADAALLLFDEGRIRLSTALRIALSGLF